MTCINFNSFPHATYGGGGLQLVYNIYYIIYIFVYVFLSAMGSHGYGYALYERPHGTRIFKYIMNAVLPSFFVVFSECAYIGSSVQQNLLYIIRAATKKQRLPCAYML